MTKKIIKIENESTLTTAEKVELLLKNQEEIIKVIEDVEPANLQFGDGSSVATQATRAEDIVSVYDGVLNQKIDDEIQIQNQVNTDQQVEIDGNTSRSTNNQSRLTIIEPIVQDNKDTNDVQSQIITNLDARVTDIEQTESTPFFDHSTYSATGQVTETQEVIKPTILRDFVEEDLATQELNEDGELNTTILKQSTIELDYSFTAQQGNGSTPEFTVGIYNSSTGNLIGEESISTLDFSSNITFESNTKKIIATVPENTTIQVRVVTSTGTSITITKSNIILKVSAATRISVTDKDVTSTTGLGNTNTQEDILALNNMIQSLMVGVGQILIQSEKPKYGTWEEVPTSEGMALLFGGDPSTSSSTSGEVKGHAHFTINNNDSADITGMDETKSLRRRFGNSGVEAYGLQGDVEEPIWGKSSSTGGSQNKAYGIKVGIKIWRRTA